MTREVKSAATGFGDIAYEERGHGPAALFVHGVFLNGHHWRHVVERVADLRRCISIDLMAHGATRITPDQDVSFTAQADMLEAFCDQLGLDQIDLVGNDSGGAIAQIFAARHSPRLRSLTLTNCDVHDGWPPEPFQATVNAARQHQLGEIGRRMLADIPFARSRLSRAFEHPERLSEETIRVYLAPLYSTAEGTRNLERFIAAMDCRQTVAIEPLLRRLEAPTLVVWATGDIFFDVKWAYWLRDAIPGCRKVIELPGAMLFFPEERPDALATALREHWQASAEPPARRRA